MYASHFLRWLTGLRRSIWKTVVLRSGTVILIVVGLVLLAIGIAWRERGRGKLTKLKAELAPRQAQTAVAPAPPPGGQDPVILQRSQIMGGVAPEFLSATLLPGMGMDVLQLTAYLPDRGEVNLLVAPTLEEVSQMASGKEGADLRSLALKTGGALEAPWAGRLTGTKMATGDGIMTLWNGRGLILPSTNGVADGGLLLTRHTDSVKQNVMPDGGDLQAVTIADSFDGHWPSHTEVTTTVLLSSRSFSIRMVAKNVGTEPEPIGLGWRPKFAIISGDRANLQLKIPQSVRMEHMKPGGLPTGKLLPVTGTEYDFSAPNGLPLKSVNLDDSFVHLKPELMIDSPTVELRDTAANYMLRMTMLTRSIRSLHIVSPASTNADDKLDKPFIAISPETNYEDALGREWPKDEDTGIVVLQPGESMQWNIRLELFPLAPQSSNLP
jgi:aldose 1-epimerase